jgi:hypothetical protein
MITAGCVICTEPYVKVNNNSGHDSYSVECPNCGQYSITGTASRVLAASPLIDNRQIVNSIGWLRENQGILLNSNDVESLRTLQSPSVAERAKKLLVAFNREEPSIGTIIRIGDNEGNTPYWCAVSWSANLNELSYLLYQYMEETKGWIVHRQSMIDMCFQISPKGYDYLEELRVGTKINGSGFCAMWFSPEVTSAWSDAIKPAMQAAGYEAVRIDGVEHNNKIDDEILASIRASRFVVADFTGERGGVYFEAGFAMGLGRPVIWTVREDFLPKIHFDNRQYNFIVWKPDDLSDFAKRLQLRIEATIGRGPLYSPIMT